MKCPKCGSGMSPVAAMYGKSVDRCNHCRGLFVSRDALASIERDWWMWPKADPRTIDSGDPATGKRYDALGDIDCPSCGTKMSAISMRDQPHIWLEQCPACKGIFFDAGELTDLRYNTLADWVRDFLKGSRPSF